MPSMAQCVPPEGERRIRPVCDLSDRQTAQRVARTFIINEFAESQRSLLHRARDDSKPQGLKFRKQTIIILPGIYCLLFLHKWQAASEKIESMTGLRMESCTVDQRLLQTSAGYDSHPSIFSCIVWLGDTHNHSL